MKKLSLMFACVGIISAATFGNVYQSVPQDGKAKKEPVKKEETAKPVTTAATAPAPAKNESPKAKPIKSNGAKRVNKQAAPESKAAEKPAQGK